MTGLLMKMFACPVPTCRRRDVKLVRTRGGVKLLGCHHVSLTKIEMMTDGGSLWLDFKTTGGIVL